MSEKTTTSRRSFLKWAGIGAVGTAAGASAARAAEQAETDRDGSARYRETDHVKKVYELARF